MPVEIGGSIGMLGPDLIEIGLGGAGERSGQTGGFSGSGEVCNKDHESLSFPGFQTLGVFWDQTPGRSAASRVFCAITPTSAWGV